MFYILLCVLCLYIKLMQRKMKNNHNLRQRPIVLPIILKREKSVQKKIMIVINEKKYLIIVIIIIYYDINILLITKLPKMY